jgi:hypothetical protein
MKRKRKNLEDKVVMLTPPPSWITSASPWTPLVYRVRCTGYPRMLGQYAHGLSGVIDASCDNMFSQSAMALRLSL